MKADEPVRMEPAIDIELQHPFRAASPADDRALAELVNMAGEGMPLYLWRGMAGPNESPWDIGRSRAQRDSGSFSYRNAVVREDDGGVVACVIGYPLADPAGPVNYGDMPAMFVPLQELEDLAPGTWYVNVLATYPAHRGKGYGAELLSLAEKIALDTNRKGMSLIVSDANTGARRLYDSVGYRERAVRPMVKDDWEHSGENWVLLVKEF